MCVCLCEAYSFECVVRSVRSNVKCIVCMCLCGELMVLALLELFMLYSKARNEFVEEEEKKCANP